jgi:molybdate-binding protein/DNA-binding XRE family transcriptional regulator
MNDSIRPRLRQRREELGLSQVALAAAAELTRQSVGAIEAGRAVPGVDVALRLARALGCGVEDLFGQREPEGSVQAEAFERGTSGRVVVARLFGRLVAYELRGADVRTAADALVTTADSEHVTLEPLRPPPEFAETIIVMGCAPALGIVSDHLNRAAAPGRYVWLSGSSTAALAALGKHQTHMAGVHLVDARSGDANVADVRRLAGSEPSVLITLARWEAGIVLPRGNPKRIRTGAHLTRRGLRLAVRELGSGARRLLDRQLKNAGAPPTLPRSAAVVQVRGQLEVAQAVALGAADAGIATRDAALAFGLDFVSLAEERYDLALPLALLSDARLQRWFDALTSAAVRRELSVLGYDVRQSGTRVAEVHAA